jgi:TRAP-type C4-dicarboxylate transport system permease small subunit
MDGMIRSKYSKSVINLVSERGEEIFASLLLGIVVLCLTFAMTVRYFLGGIPILSFLSHITEEVAVYAFTWSVYIGAALSTKNNAHFRVTAHFAFLPEKWKKYILLPGEMIWLLSNILIVKLGWDLVRSSIGQVSISAEFPMEIVYAVIPVGFMLILLRQIQSLFSFYRDKKSKISEKP